MKKLIVLGSAMAIIVACVGFTSENVSKTMTSQPLPPDVKEEYLTPVENENGTLEYTTETFTATMTSINKEAASVSQENTAIKVESVVLPEDIKEEYLEPIKVADGVYEYRDTAGNLVATMYEYEHPEDIPSTKVATAASQKYDIDMEVEAKGAAYGSENINIENLTSIKYEIDFARETPSLLGQYVERDGKVSWYSPASYTGFYRSYTIIGNAPISVAIKNEGTQNNIYTGTVTVSPAT